MSALWCSLAHAVNKAETWNVLVLYSNNRLVPGNVAVDRGLREVLSSALDRPIDTFVEFLDSPEFIGEAYENTVTSYLRDKYAAHPPDALVAINQAAFDFLIRRRAELFPRAPVVHAVVSKTYLQSLSALPVDVVGVPIEYDYVGTIKQGLRWHPNARRLVIVTGASAVDREREERLRREVGAISVATDVEFVAGLPTTLVLQRLAGLNKDAVVFTPGYFQDGDGRLFSPYDSAALIAAASGAPVYGPVDTFIGIGVVGGLMPSFEDIGRQAAHIVVQLRAGAAPASLQLPGITPTALRVDWRQIRRWGIDQSQVPADTVVYFKEPTLWEAYRNVVIATAAVVLLLAAMVITLLLEHGRRRTVERAMQKQHIELAHVSRLAVAGELTASIAHEINQPLGAVQTSADAADLILHSGEDRREDLLRIVTRIRRDIQRAGDVIRRLRALLSRHESEQKSFDLNSAMNDVANLLRAEALQRQVTLDFRSTATPAHVLGDETQIQQVLINLVLNAMDAVADMREDQRKIVVSLERVGGTISIAVRDRGHGVAQNDLPKLFDSFYSTKPRGMGLGLSIARTIVESHGGRIWAESGNGDGAVFRFELPASSEAGAPMPVTT